MAGDIIRCISLPSRPRTPTPDARRSHLKTKRHKAEGSTQNQPYPINLHSERSASLCLEFASSIFRIRIDRLPCVRRLFLTLCKDRNSRREDLWYQDIRWTAFGDPTSNTNTLRYFVCLCADINRRLLS